MTEDGKTDDTAARMRPAVTRRSVLAALAAATLLPPAPGRAATRLDPALLAAASHRAERLDQLNSLIVARGGSIALGEAYRGPGLDTPVNVKSVSKTIVASLAGTALDRGEIAGLDAPLADLAPDLIPAGADPRVREITLAHLLTMTAGLERTSGSGYGAWVASRNWVAHALSRPFVADPGDRMLYSTGSYHLAGAVLAEVTGDSLLALARDRLGTPLGVRIPPWTRDPQGRYMGGNNMALSPTSLFRFGEMWRAGGVWDGRRVLSRQWIGASWTPRTRSPYSGDAYGYGWFLTRLGDHPAAYARGYGGQMLWVVPSLELTVAITSDPTRPARSHGYVAELRALLEETVVPAAEGDT